MYNRFFELVGTKNEGKRFNLNTVGRSFNCSSKIISKYKNRVYTGNVKGLEKKISDWLKQETERVSKREITLSEEALDKMKKVIDDVWFFRKIDSISLVVWNEALGKTAALQRCIDEIKLPIFLIEAKPHFTNKTLMAELAWSMGIDKNISLDLYAVIESLKEQDAILIIDDVDYLSDSLLDLIRNIGDQTTIGLIFLGSLHLEYRIRHQGFEYISSRIGDSYVKIDKWTL